ncbi:SIS domain-containing protein [Brachybacterium alimentarium]|uniref:SIS domain-containing protein n=1 Tax=Brachybacterium alimentarium TaxID=47845 RepID=UPI000DF27BE3|nr:SIS domain-containing protein [Brachybacterium alimentarium]RCS93449.1 SIS domain-containing protein [Brachybacterium alimentarium]
MPFDIDQTPTATLTEIRQQPKAWRELVEVLAGARTQLDMFLREALVDPRTRILMTGAGTSAFIGEIAAESLRRRTGRRVDAVATTDIVATPHAVLAERLPVLLVSFARSGNSPESVAATELVEELSPSVRHLVITCDSDGLIASEHRNRATSFVLDMPPRTNDTGFAMTSSFSTMLLAVQLAFVDSATGAVEDLAATATSLLEDQQRLEDLIPSDTHRIVYLGSGPLEGLARESALKALELTAGRVAAFHDTPLGFRHGPKAILDPNTAVVLYRSADPYTARYDDDLLRELRAARVGAVVQIGAATGGGRDVTLPGLEALDDGLRSVAMVVVAQLIGYTSSLRHGCTPDNPFPNGSVNRVVQGVTIHPLDAQEL